MYTDDEGTIKDLHTIHEPTFEEICKEYQQRCLFLLLGVQSAITGTCISITGTNISISIS